MPRISRTRLPAFTLVELLVTIGVIVMLIGITFPTINLMVKSNRVEAGVDTVNVAVTATRAYARRVKQFIDADSGAIFGSTSGVALLFTPSGELRLVENTKDPYDITVSVPDPISGTNSNKRIPLAMPWGAPRLDTAPLASGGTIGFRNTALNGYTDIADHDYITLPRGSGVLGVVADPVNHNIGLLAPPFAVRFDTTGAMVIGNPNDATSYVFYDGNCNGTIELSSARTSTYDPKDWGATPANFATATNYNRYRLPFERIESVVALLVYSKNDTTNGLYTFEAGTNGFVNDRTKAFLLESTGGAAPKLKRAKLLFFSRYTGTLMRE